MESRIYPPLCVFEISHKAPINPNDEKTIELKLDKRKYLDPSMVAKLNNMQLRARLAVSYTHLTLPTSDLV